jgi:V-type H+-transporting ATPase proteolipid subunit
MQRHALAALIRPSHLLFSIIFCEAVAIYGVIVAIILQTRIDNVEPLEDGTWGIGVMKAGYAILGAGITTGFANLVCG